MNMAPAVHSYLFVPGNRPERFVKAGASGAGAVIADLEDAVAPTDKVAAREALAAALMDGADGVAPRLLVRINGVDTRWFQDDVELCRRAGVAGIVLPKADSAQVIDQLAAQVGPGTPILPLIETAQGMWNAHAIACSTGVQRLLFGAIDFQLDLGIDGDDEELSSFRSRLVLVSRVAGIAAPVDGVTTAIDDVQRLRADALRARRFGFGAKLCIHPKQVHTVNACFQPDDEAVRWARRVLQAAAGAQGAAVAVDGRMVDKPVLQRAQSILAQAGEI
jgi:citrate lyase subunit beta/citryl-CoA lyase